MQAQRRTAIEGTGFLSPKALGVIRDDGEHAAISRRRIERGERVAVWGGEVVDSRLIHSFAGGSRNTVQIEEDLFLISTNDGPADWINHSCDPNLGVQGQIVLVAMRIIAPNEELTFDYAMTDGCDYDVFECSCRSHRCRGRIDGNGWRDPDLQTRYRGFFSAYLAKRIARGCDQ